MIDYNYYFKTIRTNLFNQFNPSLPGKAKRRRVLLIDHELNELDKYERILKLFNKMISDNPFHPPVRLRQLTDGIMK